jgi:gamma-glutamylcyclotransferase (GGCT)/AIG2-like uncharacterized protein YtfP
MKREPVYLFVYGTLLQDFRNPFAVFLKRNSELVAHGSFPGQLFDLGSYPGAIYRHGHTSKVYGQIVKLTGNPAKTLAALDDYEGVTGDTSEPENEYVRRIVPVDANGMVLDCWVYLYNGDLSTALPIPAGNYLTYRHKPT